MIGQMTRDLDDLLAARKWPVRVFYGPEYQTQDDFAERILISRDESGDGFMAVKGQQRNPQARATRLLTCRAEIWAQSTVDGARYENHADRLEDVIDAFVTALQDWGKKAGASPDMVGQITSGRPIPADEMNGRQTWSGVKYELFFQVPRGVFRVDDTGAGAAEATAPGFTNRTDVYRQAAPDGATPETGCGG